MKQSKRSMLEDTNSKQEPCDLQKLRGSLYAGIKPIAGYPEIQRHQQH